MSDHEKPCNRPCHKTGESQDLVIESCSQGQARAKILTPVTIQQLVEVFRELSPTDLKTEIVADILRSHHVKEDSLSRYVRFSSGDYMRNLVFKNEHFEVMVLCWDVGQVTPIHNHEGQNCWVSVLAGQLSFKNYRWVKCDRKERTTHVEELSTVPLAAEGSLSVIDERDTIHRLGNDRGFGARAMSLHVYSKPLETCVIYDDEKGACFDKRLHHDSIDGRESQLNSL